MIEAAVALLTAPFPAFLLGLLAGTIALTAYVERTPMTFIIATVSTGYFEWTALGDSEQECNVALDNAYAEHARQTPDADPRLMMELIMAGEVNYHEIRKGEALRDGSRVPRSFR